MEMPFWLWTRVGRSKHVLDGDALWRYLANTTEASMCSGDAALCQITLTTCLYVYDCIFDLSTIPETADLKPPLRRSMADACDASFRRSSPRPRHLESRGMESYILAYIDVHGRGHARPILSDLLNVTAIGLRVTTFTACWRQKFVRPHS